MTCSCKSSIEKFGDAVDSGIAGAYGRLGYFVGNRPRTTIIISFIVAAIFGVGFINFTTESRPEELWVPQGTQAEVEREIFETYWSATSRVENIIVQPKDGDNVLTRSVLEDAMRMHLEIETGKSVVENEDYVLTDLCTKSGGTCSNEAAGPICQCRVSSILKSWDYSLGVLQNDTDFMATLQQYGTREDLEAVLGNSVWTDDDQLVSAEAFNLFYFLQDRSKVENGEEVDPINEGWEKQVFLDVAEDVEDTYSTLKIDYSAGRSFSDEFGGAIQGDILLVFVSYVIVFVFIGATMGKFKCGPGSRWTMALAALVTVGVSVVAGFGLSSLFGQIFSPVHQLLPFVLLGLGVDDAFVIVNAFDRERKGPRSHESNKDLVDRTKRSLARAGSSILVTSLTDIVAFAISASSALPALASFGAFAAICIFFLWAFSATFFTACLHFDERRQRDNRKEILCCVSRKGEVEEDEYEEGRMSGYFRKYHGPTILSKIGKVVVLVVFAGLLAFGIFGAVNLPVEDSSRSFIPAGSYLNGYLDATDEYFPEQGINFFITFEGSSDIYSSREALSELDSRLSGKSTAPPYISEPVSDEAYRNVMDDFATYLETSGTSAIGGAELGEDGWPMTEADFVSSLAQYANVTGPGSKFARDVSFSEDGAALEAYRVELEYVKLVKTNTRNGEIIPDADKQIEAMDATRDMVNSWDDLPPASPYSSRYQNIEGYKVIKNELYLNVGLALACVTVIVFCTVANVVAALLIALNVACCVTEILGFMWALGIVIDSVSVINLVLAVGLSVDYSAHVGHCFMTKGGEDKNKRAIESLADIGAAVLQGATTTFLAVVVLLFSSSYVFEVLSRQFAMTVVLGVFHGIFVLPVLLALLGPKPYSSAKSTEAEEEEGVEKSDDKIASTAHAPGSSDSSSDEDGSGEKNVDTAVEAESVEDLELTEEKE